MDNFYDEELPAGFQDADFDQREMEEEGNRIAAKSRQSRALREAGNLVAAANTCPHGGGYPLASPAAEHENDPNAGEEGVRCSDCGSRLSAFAWDGGTVVVPCEI